MSPSCPPRSARWAPLDHTYHIGSGAVDVPRDWREHAKRLGSLFPESAGGIEALFNDMRAIFDGMYAGAANNSGIPRPPRTIKDLLAFPKRHPLAYRWLNRPFSDLLAVHIPGAAAQRMLLRLAGYITDQAATLSVPSFRTSTSKHTFLDLVEPAYLSSDFRSAIARIEPACSAFSVHLAIDFVPTTNPILDVIPSTGPVVQIVIPSLVDPSAAPPGFATIEITTLLPHAEARLWFRETPADSHGAEKQAVACRARKSDLGDELVAVAETVIPDLRRHIVFRAEATPVSGKCDWKLREGRPESAGKDSVRSIPRNGTSHWTW